MDERPEKYVVLKVEDWANYLASFRLALGEDSDAVRVVEDAVLDDAVVIRLQDTFAYVGLNAYADAMLIAVELMQDLTAFDEPDLISVIDYFKGKAEKARQLMESGQTKLPTL